MKLSEMEMDEETKALERKLIEKITVLCKNQDN